MEKNIYNIGSLQDINVKKTYNTIAYDDYGYVINVYKLEDNYIYAVARSVDTGYAMWTRGRKKDTIIKRIKKAIRDMHKEYSAHNPAPRLWRPR